MSPTHHLACPLLPMTIFAPRIANVVMLPPVSAIVAVPSSARKSTYAKDWLLNMCLLKT
jgi:hypothetical protein